MARGFDGIGVGQIATLFGGGAVASLSDGELLGRFLEDRDEKGEAAFGALVLRHGPLVLGVCRRALRDAHQAEDAFQATFLVLARKARSIRNREAVGPWLAGVAGKVAARARGDAARRRAHEEKAAGLAPSSTPPLATPGGTDEVDLLMGEVDRLRGPLREAVILCHLQGQSYLSAAEALGVSEGTIRGRLARAREVLRARLGRRGLSRDVSASSWLAAGLLPPAPARLVEATARGSWAFSRGKAVAGAVPRSAITLMEGVVRGMMIAKLRQAAVLALGIGLITAGAAVRVHARQKPAKARPEKPSTPASAKAEEVDLAAVVDGKIVRTAEVAKDCMVLSYLPDWAFGDVDNIALANNGGGVRTLVDWPDVPAAEAKDPDRKFYLAFYSRKTTAEPKPGSIVAFELTKDWPERSSWKTRPGYEPEPVLTAKFEPGEGWKAFDVTSVIRNREGKSGEGLMLRFLSEDRGDWSGYAFVSREGEGEWVNRRPRLVVVEPARK